MVDGNLLEQAFQFVSEGEEHFKSSDLWESKNNYEKAIEIFERLPGTEKECAFCHLAIEHIFLEKGIMEGQEAYKSFERALSFFRKVRNSQAECASCYFHMCTALKTIGNYEEALRQSENFFMIFYEAIRMNDFTTVDIIITKLTGANTKNERRATPLHMASYHGRRDIAGYLLSKGARVNEVDRNGHTPLHLAAHQGNMDVVKLLVSHGADLGIRDNWGRTPLEWADRKGYRNIVEFLNFLEIMQRSFPQNKIT